MTSGIRHKERVNDRGKKGVKGDDNNPMNNRSKGKTTAFQKNSLITEYHTCGEVCLVM